jgi:hypothetical protein
MDRSRRVVGLEANALAAFEWIIGLDVSDVPLRAVQL